MNVDVCPYCGETLFHTVISASVVMDCSYCVRCGYRREKIRKTPGVKSRARVNGRFREVRYGRRRCYG